MDLSKLCILSVCCDNRADSNIWQFHHDIGYIMYPHLLDFCNVTSVANFVRLLDFEEVCSRESFLILFDLVEAITSTPSITFWS